MKETTVSALGKTWTFSSRMEWGCIKQFFSWIAEREGDVFEDLERFIDKIPEADRAKLFRERQERRDQIKSLNLQSPVAREYQQTPEGVGYLALALLRVNHPDVTLEQAMLVMQSADPLAMAEIQRAAERAAKGHAKNASVPA